MRRLHQNILTVCALISIILLLNNVSKRVMKPFKMSPLNIVRDSDLPPVRIRECVRKNLLGEDINWLICFKDVNEALSNTLYELEGPWEVDVAYSLAEILMMYPEAVYLDIGTNIGPHVLMAATMGHKVYAVEPILKNLAFISESAKLAHIENKITMINNAASNENIVLTPWVIDEENESNAIMLTQQELKKLSEQEKTRTSAPISTVTLEQILGLIMEKTIILKIDVEGFECKVLKKYLTSNNKSHFIPYITLEWEWIQRNENGKCSKSELNTIIKGFESSGYTGYQTGRITENTLNVPLSNSILANSKISQVVFIHKDALPTINKFKKEHVKIEDKKYVKIIKNISDDKKNK